MGDAPVTAPRDLALYALDRQEERPGYPERYLERRFQEERGLTDRDRAFAVHLVQGVLRWRRRLDWVIEQGLKFPFNKIDPPVLNVLRLALYQIFFMDRVPESAAVNEAVKQARTRGRRHVAGFVNGLLRNTCRRKDSIVFPDREKDLPAFLSTYYSYPGWLVQKWLRELGPAVTERLLEAENRIPRLGVRANLLRGGREDLIAKLAGEGVTATRMPYSPEGVFLEDLKGSVVRLESFKQGLFQVQGEAAQLSSLLLDPTPGEVLLDLCAGVGGKTTHLAEIMEDRGRVIALDMSHSRLVSLADTVRRLGITSVLPLAADATGSLQGLLKRQFDRILIDGPCSGLGVLSKHPDGKWSKTEEDVGRLSLVQGRILHEAAPLLKRGGRMLYVVCTLSQEENEGVVEAFLEEHGDLALEDLKKKAPKWAEPLIDEQGFFRTLPHAHGTEGFFGALFVKRP